MTDAYQNRIAVTVPRLRYGAIGLGSFKRLRLDFLACMNDLNGRGQRISFTDRYPARQHVRSGCEAA
jgi:hypothetical protein